jgi:ABC-type sugar transport system permease subunit
MLGDVIVATIWLFIYHPTIGMLNYFLKLIGIEIGAVPWLGQANTALIAVTMPMIWKFTGLYIILFLAAMQEIPQSYLDAARIDGASVWQEFYWVVLPLIRPTIAVAVVFLMWNSFSVIFTYVKLLTEGGPHRSTEVLPTYIYQVGFEYHEFGYGAAISVAAFILIFALAAFILRFLMERVVRGEKGF